MNTNTIARSSSRLIRYRSQLTKVTKQLPVSASFCTAAATKQQFSTTQTPSSISQILSTPPTFVTRVEERPRAENKFRFYPVYNSETPRDKIRVVSYNILAESLALRHQKLYQHCSPQSLSWEKRLQKLVDQLKSLNADVFCLQEVDNFDILLQHLKPLGYSGLFKKRTSAKNKDGCATFWKTNRFQVLASEGIEFCKSQTQSDNVALCTSLSLDEENKHILCIVSTHLLFDPTRGDIKLGQVQYLLSQVHHHVKQIKKANPEATVSIAIAGDMNSTPYSGIWRLFKHGEITFNSKNAPDWKNVISGQNPMKDNYSLTSDDSDESADETGSIVKYSHKFEDLESAYANYNDVHKQLFDNQIEYPEKTLFNVTTYGEPRVTSMVNGCKNAVDSIWFTSDNLTLHSLLSLPQQNRLLQSSRSLPSISHPSDHFVLGAEFYVGPK